MKFVLYFLFCVTAIYSCDERPAKQDAVKVIPAASTADTTTEVIAPRAATSLADSLPSGAYQGMFPCKGCEGIRQTILFNHDKSYQQEQLVWGKDTVTKTSEGRWQRKEGKIELSQHNKTAIILMKKNDTLYGVNINGILVNDSSKYILTKRKLAASNPLWDRKRSRGILFTGLGNEPFWNLEIDNKKSILFNLAGWKKPLVVPIENPVINKDSTVYHLKTDTATWTVTILPQFCMDGMSDYLYQYKVNINFQGTIYQGCGILFNNKKIQ